MLPIAEPARIAVAAERPYQVLVGNGLLAEVPALLGAGVQRVALLHPPTMIETAEQLSQLLTAAGLEPVRIDVPDAEAAKSVAVAERCWSILGNAGFTRSDGVVGLGGGATTDLAGFVAATWLRGVLGSWSRPACWAWLTPLSAARPASTQRKARTSLVASTSRRA